MEADEAEEEEDSGMKSYTEASVAADENGE